MTWVLVWREHLVLAEPVGQLAPETTDSIDAAMKFPTYGAGRAWAEGLWSDNVLQDTSRVFLISADQLVALREWRATHSVHWRYWLKKRWDRGDCKPELRQLRNVFGPEWLHKQRLVR
jgi:hypothetical protein